MRYLDRRLLWRRRLPRFVIAATLVLTLLTVAQNGKQFPSSELKPGSAELIQPEQLVKALRSPGAAKPVILYVGPPFLYAQAHIPGAEFIGPSLDAQALEKLRKRTASLSRNSPLVLYCGCCPWEHCPNIRPAYNELHKMGFENVKALYLADSFGTNWVDKGYPVEKASSGR